MNDTHKCTLVRHFILAVCETLTGLASSAKLDPETRVLRLRSRDLSCLLPRKIYTIGLSHFYASLGEVPPAAGHHLRTSPASKREL